MTALEMITYLTIGPLLMYWWMGRRLDRSVAAADRCAARRPAAGTTPEDTIQHSISPIIFPKKAREP